MFTSVRNIFSAEKMPLDALKAKTTQIGHPQFPFLHRTYSPLSRVPCADFTEFIAGCLQRKDVHSVTCLMHEILRGNPGLGLSSSWIDKRINEILSINFAKYIKFEEPKAYYELAAMWIIAAKDGAGPEFWISPLCKFPTFFAWALCSYQVALQPEIFRLVQVANIWLRKMQREAPAWLDFPFFEECDLQVLPVECYTARKKILELSTGARLHLFTALCFGLGSLPWIPDYKLRYYGLNIQDSVQEILQSELLVPGGNVGSVAETMSREELMLACNNLGVEIKKSWNRSKLLAKAIAAHPEFADQLMNSKCIVKTNPQFEAELSLLFDRSQKMGTIFKVLCFAS